MNLTVQVAIEEQMTDSKTEQKGGLSVRTDLRAGNDDISAMFKEALAQLKSTYAAQAPVAADPA